MLARLNVRSYQGDDLVEGHGRHVGIFPDEKAKETQRFFTRAGVFDDLLQKNVSLIDDICHRLRHRTDRTILMCVVRIAQQLRVGLGGKRRSTPSHTDAAMLTWRGLQ